MGLKNRFDLGEIDRWNWGQTDSEAYSSAVARLENFSILPQGGLNRREGWKRLRRMGELADDSAARMIRLQKDGTDYLLVITPSEYGAYNCRTGEFKRYPAPAPQIVPPERTADFYKQIPGQFYSVTGFSTLAQGEGLSLGDTFSLPAHGAAQPAVIELEDVSPASSAGEIQEIAPREQSVHAEAFCKFPDTSKDRVIYKSRNGGSGAVCSARVITQTVYGADGNFSEKRFLQPFVKTSGKGYLDGSHRLVLYFKDLHFPFYCLGHFQGGALKQILPAGGIYDIEGLSIENVSYTETRPVTADDPEGGVILADFPAHPVKAEFVNVRYFHDEGAVALTPGNYAAELNAAWGEGAAMRAEWEEGAEDPEAWTETAVTVRTVTRPAGVPGEYVKEIFIDKSMPPPDAAGECFFSNGSRLRFVPSPPKPPDKPYENKAGLEFIYSFGGNEYTNTLASDGVWANGIQVIPVNAECLYSEAPPFGYTVIREFASAPDILRAAEFAAPVPPMNGELAQSARAEGLHENAASLFLFLKKIPLRADGAGWVISWELQTAGGKPRAGMFEAGEPLSFSWEFEGAVPGASGQAPGIPLSCAATRVALKDVYRFRLVSGGSYPASVAGREIKAQKTGADGPAVRIESESFFGGSGTALLGFANPEAGLPYKVLFDETAGGNENYYVWNGAEWRRHASGWPGAAALGEMRFIAKQDSAVCASFAHPPLYFKITAAGGVTTGAAEVSRAVPVVETKPEDFTWANTVVNHDETVDAGFCAEDGQYPRVIAYISGRVWLANTYKNPNKIWVSRRTEDITRFNVSSYNIYATVTKRFTPFYAENPARTQTLSVCAESPASFAEFRAKAAEPELKTFDGKVNYGYVSCRIGPTKYFKYGSAAESRGETVVLREPHVPAADEYDENAEAEFRSEYERVKKFLFMYRTLPYGTGSITMNCEGAMGDIILSGSGAPITIGPAFTIGNGTVGSPQTLFQWTSWGENNENMAGMISSAAVKTAAAASVAADSKNYVTAAAYGVAGGVASIVIGVAGTWAKERIRDLSELTVRLTGGGRVRITWSDAGIRSPTAHAIDSVLLYVTTKYSLYAKAQPFMGESWDVSKEEYSAADCGFSLELGGEAGEEVSGIIQNFETLIFTNKKERMAPHDINGEKQSAREISGEGTEFAEPAAQGAAVYAARAGGMSILKEAWQSGMDKPSALTANERNIEIFDGFLTARIIPTQAYPKKIRFLSEAGTFTACQIVNGREAFYRETTYGKILDAASFKEGQSESVYVLRRQENGEISLDRLSDRYGKTGGVFLDSWSEYAGPGDLIHYDGAAVIYDEESDKTYAPAEFSAAPQGGKAYIGYPYKSAVRTLPAAGPHDMSPRRIARAKIRLEDSAMPFVKGFPEGGTDKVTDSLGRKSGVFDIPVPGTNHREAAFEIFTEHPGPLSVLAFYTEET